MEMTPELPPPYSEVDPQSPHSATIPRSTVPLTSPSQISLRGGYIRGVSMHDDPSAALFFQERMHEFDPELPLTTLTYIITPETTREQLIYPSQIGLDRDVSPQDWATFVNYVLTELENETSSTQKKKKGRPTAEELYSRQSQVESVIAEWNEGFFGPRSIKFVPRLHFERRSSPIPTPVAGANAQSGSTNSQPATAPIADTDSKTRQADHAAAHHHEDHHEEYPDGPFGLPLGGFLGRGGGPFNRHSGLFRGRGGPFGPGGHPLARGWGPFPHGGMHHIPHFSRGWGPSPHGAMHHDHEGHGRRHRRGGRRRSASTSSGLSSSSDSDSHSDHHGGRRRGGGRGRDHRRGREDRHRGSHHRSPSSSSSSSDSSFDSISSAGWDETGVASLRSALAKVKLDPTNKRQNKVIFHELKNDIRQQKQRSKAESSNADRAGRADLKTQRRELRSELRSLRKAARTIRKARKQERKSLKRAAKAAKKEAKRRGKQRSHDPQTNHLHPHSPSHGLGHGQQPRVVVDGQETGTTRAPDFPLPTTMPGSYPPPPDYVSNAGEPETNDHETQAQELDRQAEALDNEGRALVQEGEEATKGIRDPEKRRTASEHFATQAAEMRQQASMLREQADALRASSGSNKNNDGSRSRSLSNSIFRGGFGSPAGMGSRPGYGTRASDYAEFMGRRIERWSERFGKDMESWGEDFGRMMEAKGKKIERKFS